MAEITPERVLAALEEVLDPDMGVSIVSMGMIQNLKADGTKVAFTCELTTPACPLKKQIEENIRRTLAARIPEMTELALTMTGRVRNTPGQGTAPAAENPIPQIKHVILITGGKGGVGKTTCAFNLALALKELGARVALLDADLFTPALPLLTGLRDKPQLAGETRIQPLRAFGMEVMSMGFLVDASQALLWRGPVLNGILVQFLRDVVWSEQDYLIVDMPSGAGEVQLALTQACACTGAVLLTTPQALSIAATVRARSMLGQLGVPVLGLLENMSGLRAAPDAEPLAVFSKGGAERAAKEMSLPLLGQIPLVPALCESCDLGKPLLLEDPQSELARVFLSVAEKLAAQVSIQAFAKGSGG